MVLRISRWESRLLRDVVVIRHAWSAPTSPARVVVVGASGFVGSEIASHLEDANIDTVKCSSSEVDLCDPSSADVLQRIVRQDDALVIASAITPDKGKDVGTLMRNLAMAESVSAFLDRSPCAHVVYVSSDAVYGDGESLLRETSCCDPASFHGLMHLTRERVLTHALEKSETPLLILRPSLLYGVNDTHNGYGPNRFMRTASKARKITLFGSGEERRDHVYIADLGRLVALCLMHRSQGVLNVATGVSKSFFDVAQTIAGFFKEEVQIECLPRVMPITHRHFDIAATIRAFPFFRYTPLQTALAEVITRIA